jgi:4-alpha-glucanotransferase
MAQGAAISMRCGAPAAASLPGRRASAAAAAAAAAPLPTGGSCYGRRHSCLPRSTGRSSRGGSLVTCAAPQPPPSAGVQPYPDPFPDLEVGDDLPGSYGDSCSTPAKHRRAGVILHPTSLPGPYGMGEIGGEARRFVDWMADAGLQLWQVRRGGGWRVAEIAWLPGHV